MMGGKSRCSGRHRSRPQLEWHSTALPIALLAAAAGCLLSTSCRIIPGSGIGNAPGSPPKTQGRVSYGMDVQAIWEKNCVMCHRTGGIADRVFRVPMHLSAGQSYADIVRQPSAKKKEWVLVEPGDPEASLMYRKINEKNPPGARMPMFQPPLSATEIELVRQWIEAGAPPN